MVKGLNRFRTHFADYQDRYVLIGGTASSLTMEAFGESFRATKDFDIVLCAESLDRTFCEALWAFIKAGAYENRQKSTGKRLFYRFYAPRHDDYPEMLELFSRMPDALDLPAESELTPIPLDDEMSSLSAILMDEDYYAFVMARRVVIDGLPVINADALIPLKACAYVDLLKRKARGEQVDSKNIKKHRNDIFRLFTVLERDVSINLAQSIRSDLSEALVRISEGPVDLKPLGISSLQLPELIAELKRIYSISPA